MKKERIFTQPKEYPGSSTTAAVSGGGGILVPLALGQGRIQRGGGGPGGQDPPFGGPANFIKREKMLRVCVRKRHVLVLNGYPDSPHFQNPVSAPEIRGPSSH